jgi:hypothetical protein
MRRSHAARLLVRLGLLVAVLLLGGVLGTWYAHSCPPQTAELPKASAMVSAESAIAMAERGDREQAGILLRQAIHRAGRDPDAYYYSWNALEKLEKQSAGDGLGRDLRRVFLAGVDAAMLNTESVDDFAQLYKLQAKVRDTDHTDSVSAAAKPTHADSRAVYPADLLGVGLEALAKGDEDRAEYLTQAALSRQADDPKEAPALWKQYRAYLEIGRASCRERV